MDSISGQGVGLGEMVERRGWSTVVEHGTRGRDDTIAHGKGMS